MHSIPGIYENQKITLLQKLPKNIPESASVLITFVTEEEAQESNVAVEPEEKNEEYYQSIREFQRVEATGDITIIEDDANRSFPLNDYSQGGLSFISDHPFNVGDLISSGITDPSNPDLVLMELKMEIRGVFKTDDNRFKVGCMFLDPVDEDLWHGLLQYLR